MSGLKEIRRRITSVKNTKQITRAMKLVSAAKLRRAQQAAVSGQAFVEHLERILLRVISSLPEDFNHRLLGREESSGVRRVLVIAGERGLCGAFNSNVLKLVQQQEVIAAGGHSKQAEFVVFGRRAVAFSKRMGWNVLAKYESLSEDANSWPISEVLSTLESDYESGKFDEAVVYFTKFSSAIELKVSKIQLLPFTMPKPDEAPVFAEHEIDSPKFSPPAEELFANMVPLVLRATLLQAALESKASEHAARMTAMDSATNNADELISKLLLYYNRARQAAITKELLDILGGAEAVQ